LTAVVFIANVRFAVRNSRNVAVPREGRVGRFSQQALNLIGTIGGIALGLIVGWISKDFWREAWMAIRATEFGVNDPTFGRDVSFYVFTLPVLHGLQSSLMLLVGITLVAVAVVYLVRLGVRYG